MSNNKPIMKLYTEEQVNKAMLDYIQGISRFDIFNSLTPIELPSDEQIDQEAERLYPLTGYVSIDHRNHLRKKGFINGMEWMRDKIQGGDK